MSRTRKTLPDYDGGYWFRSPKGRVKALLNDARPKAVPPDAWDDLSIDKQARMPYRAAVSMAEQFFTKAEIINKLQKRWKLRYKQAEMLADYGINSNHYYEYRNPPKEMKKGWLRIGKKRHRKQ